MATNDLSPLMSPTDESEQVCSLCERNYNQPRVLSCLHLFCELCLERLLHEESETKSLLICPECRQETKLTSKGIAGLPLDYVMCNQLDVSAIENMQIVCTSCKTKEKAVARCCDCSNFLCPNCVTAHQYMRCFDNHKVVTFDDMKASGDGLTIHKPITCPSHSEEYMKYYCYTCQVPICNECMVVDHKQPEHQYERASDAEEKQREELQNLMAESKSKVQFCEEATNALQACLIELEQQRDNAKSLIQETFQSYRAILEKQQDELLQQLNTMHSEQELHIMDTANSVEKTIDKIEDACKFAERLLKHGNTIEILSLKQVVGSRLLYLINNTPKPEINMEIRFESEAEKFEDAVQQTFGILRKVESPTKPIEASPPQQVSPLHSMSSFDSDGFALPTGVLSPESPVPSPLDMDLSNVVTQYNLAQLVGMAESSNSHGSPSPTPSAMTLSDLLMQSSGQDIGVVAHLNALNNLTALAKIGSSSMNGDEMLLHFRDTGQMSRGSATLSRSAPSTPQPLSGRGSSLMNGSDIHTPMRGNSPPLDSLVNGAGQFNYNPPPRSATTKLNTMQIRCKFGQLGPGKGQFSSPHGFCLGMEEEIVVADTNNHRIQVFDKMGEFKFQFGIPGKEEGQLWYPRKVAIIRSSGKFVICDRGNERSRMQIFTKTGHFIRKVAIRYIDIVAGLAITSEGHIATVDSVTPTVFILSESGDVLRWFDCSGYMREPSDLAIIGKEYYICDFKGHCVIVLSEQGQFLRRIGCENLTNFPNGIDISDAGDVLVGDSHGNRFHVVVFSREGSILSEFECPYVKVSRCCGLKITSEGYIVTLAKNNHHVLVLNTLYIM